MVDDNGDNGTDNNANNSNDSSAQNEVVIVEETNNDNNDKNVHHDHDHSQLKQSKNSTQKQINNSNPNPTAFANMNTASTSTNNQNPGVTAGAANHEDNEEEKEERKRKKELSAKSLQKKKQPFRFEEHRIGEQHSIGGQMAKALLDGAWSFSPLIHAFVIRPVLTVAGAVKGVGSVPVGLAFAGTGRLAEAIANRYSDTRIGKVSKDYSVFAKNSSKICYDTAIEEAKAFIPNVAACAVGAVTLPLFYGSAYAIAITPSLRGSAGDNYNKYIEDSENRDITSRYISAYRESDGAGNSLLSRAAIGVKSAREAQLIHRLEEDAVKLKNMMRKHYDDFSAGKIDIKDFEKSKKDLRSEIYKFNKLLTKLDSNENSDLYKDLNDLRLIATATTRFKDGSDNKELNENLKEYFADPNSNRSAKAAIIKAEKEKAPNVELLAEAPNPKNKQTLKQVATENTNNTNSQNNTDDDIVIKQQPHPMYNTEDSSSSMASELTVPGGNFNLQGNSNRRMSLNSVSSDRTVYSADDDDQKSDNAMYGTLNRRSNNATQTSKYGPSLSSRMSQVANSFSQTLVTTAALGRRAIPRAIKDLQYYNKMPIVQKFPDRVKNHFFKLREEKEKSAAATNKDPNVTSEQTIQNNRSSI